MAVVKICDATGKIIEGGEEGEFPLQTGRTYHKDVIPDVEMYWRALQEGAEQARAAYGKFRALAVSAWQKKYPEGKLPDDIA